MKHLFVTRWVRSVGSLGPFLYRTEGGVLRVEYVLTRAHRAQNNDQLALAGRRDLKARSQTRKRERRWRRIVTGQ